MLKEKLTTQNIRQDLKLELKKNYMRVVGSSVFSLIIIGLIILAFSMANVYGGYYGLHFSAMACFVLGFDVFYVLRIVDIQKNLDDKKHIVKDKLVNVEVYEDIRVGIHNIVYTMHFSSYGKYVIPKENYKWSENFNMNDTGVYNYSKFGDEFYLVLSKPHTGKILMVYNTKLFDME